MPGKSRGTEEKGNHGQESSQVSLVPEITVITSDEKSKIPGGNILELEDLKPNTQVFTQGGDLEVSQTGLSNLDFPSSLSNEAPLALQATDSNASTSLSNSDQPEAEISSSCGSGHNSGSDSSSHTDLCNQKLSQLDRCSLEKTNNVSSLNFSQPNLNACESEKVQNNADEDIGVSAIDCTVGGEERGSSPPADFHHQAHQTRDSIDVRWDKGEEDQRSMISRRTVREGMCCCYQTFHRAFLQCVEETPAMLSGLVLSLAFCISIIVLIPTTGRVRPVCLCVRVCIGACAWEAHFVCVLKAGILLFLWRVRGDEVTAGANKGVAAAMCCAIQSNALWIEKDRLADLLMLCYMDVDFKGAEKRRDWRTTCDKWDCDFECENLIELSYIFLICALVKLVTFNMKQIISMAFIF